MYKGTRCPVCGSSHAYISNCPKYGVNICGAHCEICEYRIGNLPISGGYCGYSSSTKALNIPPYRFLASDTDVETEISIMKSWTTDAIAARRANVRELYNNNSSPEQKDRFRAVLTACDDLLKGRADGVIAKESISKMSAQDIVEYRKELCYYLSEDGYNRNLKNAASIALQICNQVLNERIDTA